MSSQERAFTKQIPCSPSTLLKIARIGSVDRFKLGTVRSERSKKGCKTQLRSPNRHKRRHIFHEDSTHLERNRADLDQSTIRVWTIRASRTLRWNPSTPDRRANTSSSPTRDRILGIRRTLLLHNFVSLAKVHEESKH